MMDNRTAEIVDYIRETLRGWFDEYPGLELTYYYDPGTDYHIVVYDGPEDICEHDESFTKDEIHLYEKLFETCGYRVNVLAYYRKWFPREAESDKYKDYEVLLELK